MSIPVPEDSGILVVDQIKNALANLPGSVIATVLGVIEVILRFVPTSRPASLLVPAQKVLVILGYIVSYFVAFLGKLIIVANRVKQ